MPRVVIKIPKTGLLQGQKQVSVDVVDGCGASCSQLTAKLPETLGLVDAEPQLKPEYYDTPQIKQKTE